MDEIIYVKVIKKLWLALISVLLTGILFSSLQGQTSEQIVERVSPSVAVILVGNGAGDVSKIGSGVFVRSDGILLTAYHLVKDAKEVQIRLKSGDVFDKVEMLGIDERRDVAALKIQATNLPVLPLVSADELKEGEAVYVVSHPKGLTWSSSNGVLSAVRLADDVPGAGQGFRLIQFSAPVSNGSSGGVLVDSQGRAVGLIVAQLTEGQNLNFAIPINNVTGLANMTVSMAFNNGSSLTIPKPNNPPPTPQSISYKDPQQLLLNSRTVYVNSRTMFFKEQQLINELSKRDVIKDWGWLFLDGGWNTQNKADLIIELDHAVFTYDFTFTVRHQASSIVLASGKVIIADGASGASKMVDRIIEKLSAVRDPKPKENKNEKDKKKKVSQEDEKKKQNTDKQKDKYSKQEKNL
jgi:hypothetical protein